MPSINFIPSSTFEQKPANTIKVLSPNIIKQGDQTNDLRIQLLRGDAPVNLTGKTVKWSGASSKGKFITDREAVVASNGEVTLSLMDEDAGFYGEMRVELKVIHEDGKAEKFPANDFARFTITYSLDDITQTPVFYASVAFFEQKVKQTLDASEEAKQAAKNADNRALYVEQQGDVTEAQGLFAQEKGTEARDQAAFAQQVAEENKTNWKQEVATVALRDSTYPTPQIGDTVRITGEARIDRFNGTEWITTDRYNPAVVDELTEKLADTTKYRKQLEKTDTNGLIAVNMWNGHSGNGIAENLNGSSILGGGARGYENIIGGSTANVMTTTPNVQDDDTTSAHYSVITGGYDNVVNALATILSGFHNFTEKAADHATISGGADNGITTGSGSTIGGGSEHRIHDGRSVIAGGFQNTINTGGLYATISGGRLGIASGNAASIGGGSSNQATAANSTVAGGAGNEATSGGATVSGGLTNKASNVYGVVAGGEANEAKGQYSVASGGRYSNASGNWSSVTGGLSNVASGSGAGILAGKNNTSSGTNAAVLAGNYNDASGEASTAHGSYAKSTFYGQKAHGGGQFLSVGDAQSSDIVLRYQTTDDTLRSIGANGTELSPTLPINSAWLFEYSIIAKSGSDIKAFKIKGVAQRGATGSATLVGTPTVEIVAETAGATAWTATALTGSTFTLRAQVKGEIGKTIKWVATLKTVEVIA